MSFPTHAPALKLSSSNRSAIPFCPLPLATPRYDPPGQSPAPPPHASSLGVVGPSDQCAMLRWSTLILPRCPIGRGFHFHGAQTVARLSQHHCDHPASV